MQFRSKSAQWSRGCLQVYTGDGKGKTTAALGLALRAVGAGLRVYIAQFIKKGDYSEIKALQMLGGAVEVHQFGQGMFLFREPTPEECADARRGLAAVKKAMTAAEHQVFILDEANGALHAGLFTLEELFAAVDARPEGTELILTGRNAPPELIERADLVTDMRAVKHYYESGLQARTGIER